MMIDVTCAVIEHQGKILIARRKAGKHLAGKWEFPGGKIEEGESPAQCLQRELFEELGIETRVGEFIAESIFHYNEYSIRLLAYRVEYLSGEFVPAEHDAIKWITVEEIGQYDMAAADLPIVEALKKSNK